MSERVETSGADFWGDADETEALRRYRTLVNAVDDGIYQLDPGGRFVAVNDVVLELTGHDREELVGEHVSLVLEAADVDRIEREISERLETGEPAVETFELAAQTADGGSIPCELRASLLVEGGEFRGTVGIVRDVSERKRAEEIVRERDRRRKRERELEQYRAFTEAASDVVVTIDEGSAIRTVNPAVEDVFGYEPDELVGESLTTLMPDRLADRHFDALSQYLETGDRTLDWEYVELPGVRADGSEIPLAVSFGEVEYENERYFTGIVRDVSDRKEVEAQLREREQRLSRLMENVPGVVYRCRNERGWPMEFVSDACREVTGYGPRALERGDVSWGEDVVIRTDRESLWEAVQRETGERGTFSQTYRIETEDGDVRWVRDYGRGVFEDGELVEIEGIISDITERKERERELERYETLFTESTDVNAVLDPDGTFQYLPPSVGNVLGYEPEELVGEDAFQYVHPEDRERIAEEFGRMVEDPGYRPINEFRYRHADGSWVWLESRGRNLLDDPDIEGLVAYTRDVTERKERERELERYETIVETVNDGVYVVDDEGHFTMVNDAYAEMLDYDREELVEEHVSLVVDDDVAERAQEVEAAMQGEARDAPTVEAELETVSGDRFPAEATFALLPSADGSERRVGVVRDVTERTERERELEESERRYRTLIENFPNGAVALVGEDLTYRTVGGTPLDVADVAVEKIEGKPVGEALPPTLADELVPRYEAAFEGEASTFEAESNDRIYEFSTVPIRDDDGEVFAALGMSQDITERREAQRKLAESERRYRTLVEHFPNGAVALFDEDLRYQIVGGSAFEEIDDATESVAGATVRDRYPPDLAERLEPTFEAALDGETNTFEMAFHDRDWLAHTVPVTDDDGGIFAGMVMVQEITERKERERELERALDLLNKTERIADVAGWEVDPDTMEPFWSDHLFDLLDVSDDEQPLLEEALDVYYTEDDRAIVEDAMEEALDSGEPFDVEARFPRPSGDVGWLRIQGDPEIADGAIVSLRGAAQDVTERKRRERRLEEVIEKLEESNERLEQFAYAASHDLQEPLRMVSSYLQLIDRRYGDVLDADAEEFLAYAVDGADRMKAMIEGLLEYSRVETRGDPFEPVDLNAVVAEAGRDLQVKIEEANAEIAVDDLPRVEGDESQLRQVFQNLLDNAVEYAGDEPPRVHVSAERREARGVSERSGTAAGTDRAEWVVSVRDEGIGIEPDDQERIFEVFNRLHSHDEHAGTGIGLALCERIVERHGGETWVTSEPGEGATFSVTLPGADD